MDEVQASTVVLFLALGLSLPAMGQVALPMPSGPFPVGRLALPWSDPSRLEDTGPTAGWPREVLAYV